MGCGDLAASAKDCDNIVVGGINEDVLIMKKSIFDTAVTATTTVVTNNLITPFVLSGTGACAFKHESFKGQVKYKATGVNVNGREMFKQEIEYPLTNKTAATTKLITDLGANVPVVILIQNVSKGASGADKYKVFGVNCGLYLVGPAIDSENENMGVPILKFESKEKSLETYAEHSWFTTTETATDTERDALLVPITP